MKKYLFLVSILILIFYVMLNNSPIIIENNDIEEKNIYYSNFEQENTVKLSISHDPIIINGNGEFNETNGVSSGDGTKENPFIIKNLTIDAGNGPYCISINDTNFYFKIQNCTFYNTGGIIEKGTVIFGNVSNGCIINNTISSAPVRLFNSNNNTISNNTIYNNSYISLSYSHNNTIFNNTICNSNDISIFLSHSNNTKIIENDIITCIIGIGFVKSCKNWIRENNIYNCQVGISLWSGSNNSEIYFNYIYNYSINYTDKDHNSIGNYFHDNTYEQPGGTGPTPGPPAAAVDDDKDNNGGVEDVFLIPIIISIIAAALVSTIALITHHKLRKKKQKELKKKLDKLPPVPKY